MDDMPKFREGEVAGVMRGKHIGKVGIIRKIGMMYVSLEIRGEIGLPVILKENVIRILKGSK